MMRILHLILECLTPLHCGGGEDSLQDQPVTRDAFGIWRIPGTSLAGILRHRAEAINSDVCQRLFGGRTETEDLPSMVWCADALLLDYDGQTASSKAMQGQNIEIPLGPFIRDQVCIDLTSGAAKAGGKFDVEIVPPGARFAVAITLDGWTREPDVEENQLFDQLCRELLDGQFSLGGKANSGFGRYKVLEWDCRNVDLQTPQGMEAYLNLCPCKKSPLGGEAYVPQASLALAAETGLSGSITLPLQGHGPVLVGGGSSQTSQADLISVTCPWLDYNHHELTFKHLIPGTSLKGVLRHAVWKVARSQGLDADTLLDTLFGSVNDEGQYGKISVEDAFFTGCAVTVPHVAIDRFTGGALEGALYSEEPIWLEACPLPIRIHVDKLCALEAALFFHALLDMAEGTLPVGGGGNRGNGILRLAHWPENPEIALQKLQGTMAWDGQCIFPMTPLTLATLAEQWDIALKEQVQS